MAKSVEIELKFVVPSASRAALAAEMARGSASLERRTLAAMYLDTPDRRLARAGMAWRLRREGRRWIQTLKAGGANALERFEHEVIRAGPVFDAVEHAGSPAGDRLLAILQRAQSDGVPVDVRFRTEVRRTARRIRTKGAVVEVAFDEGRLLAGEQRQRIREIEFELVSGSAVAMLALAERWRKRFGLIYDPRSKAERGDRLAEGAPFPRVRRAEPPDYPRSANANEAFAAVLDECLAQIARNAMGLIDGDPDSKVAHVHQLRVGIRRLRSGLRSFQDWTPAPPEALVDGLRALFGTLGESRDSDVLDSGVVAELAEVGAPPLSVPTAEPGPDPVEAVRDSKTQALLLAWIAWRAGLVEPPPTPAPARAQPAGDSAAAECAPGEPTSSADGSGSDTGAPEPAPEPVVLAVADAEPAPQPATDPVAFQRAVERRLRKWHKRIAADWKAFDALDEEALHDLRKRIKRQRYAVEFFAPMLRKRTVQQYLKRLAVIQDRMGELNDLFVARARYQSLVEADPAAWFALGWLAARLAEVRVLARPELGALAKADPPVR